MGVDEDAEGKRFQARFVTKLPPPLKVPSSSIAIPSNLTRLGLSAVVNGLLKAVDPEYENQPFDFLIDGEIIRVPINQFLISKGISAERTIEIEYFKAVAPRKEEEPSLHDDWVSAVDGSSPKLLVTGCYDRHARIWKQPGECSHILSGHTEAINSVALIGQKESDLITIATASKDRTLRLWKVDMGENENRLMKINAYKILRGHSAPVQCVSSQPSGDMICSGSWDCTINLWKVHEPKPVSTKKRKGKRESEETLTEGEAISAFVGHTQQVSCVYWSNENDIYSSSWDYSIRKWDVEKGVDSAKLYCSKALNCLHVGGEGSFLVASGSSDPILRVWDSRRPGNSGPVHQFSSHVSWISACKWHPNSGLHLLSASYDGKIMLWDLRTSLPLSVLKSHEEKVLCADWWKGDSVVSGGADNKLCISGQIPIN